MGAGEAFGDQWPGSRAIAAEKAFTANAFSLPGFALSTANLHWPTQPENSLYALATSNPVHEEAFYVGEAETWGTENDPVIDRRLGGTMVFGDGLALYTDEGELAGGLGLSGDESCTDHVSSWKVRHALNLDTVTAGVTKANDDNIIHDLSVDPATGRTRLRSPELQPAGNDDSRGTRRALPDRFGGIKRRLASPKVTSRHSVAARPATPTSAATCRASRATVCVTALPRCSGIPG